MLNKLKNIFRNKNKIVALGMAIIMCIGTIVYATTPPLTENNWSDPTVWPGWTESLYNGTDSNGQPKNPYNYLATGLAVNSTWLNVVQTGGAQYPLGAIRFLTNRDGATVPDEFKEFEGKYIYCVANHVPNYVMNNGMQAFKMEEWDPTSPFEYCAGTGDIKKFNFIMLAIACNYGTENEDYHPEELNNAYYGIVSQSIAWICTATQAEQSSQGVFKGESFAEDLAILRNYPIYYAVMDRSFPQNVNPAIYNYLHSPAPNDWHENHY